MQPSIGTSLQIPWVLTEPGAGKDTIPPSNLRWLEQKDTLVHGHRPALPNPARNASGNLTSLFSFQVPHQLRH